MESVVSQEELESLGKVKIFLWSNKENMIPIKEPLNVGMVSSENAGGAFIENITYDVNSDGSILITGNGLENQNISIRITDLSGTLLYVNQIKADENGNFSTVASLKNSEFGRCKIILSCDGINSLS